MNRRGFLNAAGLAAAALVAPHSIVSAQEKQNAGRATAKSNRKYARLNLRELRDQYRKDLFTDFLPFMNEFVIDHELGGFMCN
ncbi:MAG TPA: twin-arginine translocation signal domain-containing protein, partial [Pyrinomonadaceae bacterium]